MKIDNNLNNEIKIEILHKEIDLIQGCITRMANNSFLIKGWYLTLILGFLTFGAEKFSNNILLLGSLMITLIFWIGDTYFLVLEKKYRNEYEWIINNRLCNFNFKNIYNLTPIYFNNKIKVQFVNVFFSKTLLTTYIFPFVLIIIYA